MPQINEWRLTRITDPKAQVKMWVVTWQDGKLAVINHPYRGLECVPVTIEAIQPDLTEQQTIDEDFGITNDPSNPSK